MWKVILNSSGTEEGDPSGCAVFLRLVYNMDAVTETTERVFSSVSSQQQSFFGTPIMSESSSAWLSQPTQEIPHLDEPNMQGGKLAVVHM